MIRRCTVPTSTSIVERALKAANDFVTARQLYVTLSADQHLDITINRISAALYHLRKYHAADFIEAGNALWWFATPADDTRSRKVEEHVPESRPRKPRKTKRQLLREGQ
jgi:hypothetical protein